MTIFAKYIFTALRSFAARAGGFLKVAMRHIRRIAKIVKESFFYFKKVLLCIRVACSYTYHGFGERTVTDNIFALTTGFVFGDREA